MNKLEILTYYGFGWFLIFLFNFGRWRQVPRWFWAVDFCPGPVYRMLWLGVITFSWLKDEPLGQKEFSWDWNID